MRFASLEEKLDKLITAKLDKIFNPDRPVLGDGFFSADQLRGITAAWKIVPYGNYFMTVKLKTLHAGDMPLISLVDRSKELKEKPSFDNHAWMLNTMEDYCKKSMLIPTYQQAIDIVCEETKRKPQDEKAELERALKDLSKITDPVKKAAKNSEIQTLSLSVGMYLPFNFMQAVAFWCECLDVSQIRDLTPDMLINAAAQSKAFGKDPASYVGGVFTTQNRREINSISLELYDKKYPPKEKGRRK